MKREHDKTWKRGCETAVITCAGCDTIVVYDKNAATKPLYCKKCGNKQIKRLISKHEVGGLLVFKPHEFDDMIRREQQVRKRKTRQVKL
jgi:predicted RNA-binding Zn-ribbon protein involved in translation (DUF1610 family)